MGFLQVLYKFFSREVLIPLKIVGIIDEIYHSKECFAVNTIEFANLLNALVPYSQ